MIGGKNCSAGHRQRWLPWLTAGLVLLGVGCDRGPKRYPVSGRVLYDGKPIPFGEIYFDPDVSKGNDGPQGFSRIIDSQYDTRQGGLAAASGPHVVRILGFDGKPGPELPLGRPLFSEYTTSANIPDQGDATLDFAVPARGRTR
jgi:hypothetical protein